MEWLEVYLGISYQHITIDVVEWQNTSDEDVSLFVEWLLGNTLNQTHVESFLIFLLYHHFMDVVFKFEGIFLLGVAIECYDPIHQFVWVLVARVDV